MKKAQTFIRCRNREWSTRGGARVLRCERLHLLSQSAGFAPSMAGSGYRAKMGRSPQRAAARLHFRTTCFFSGRCAWVRTSRISAARAAPAEQESPAPASSPATQGAAASPGASKTADQALLRRLLHLQSLPQQRPLQAQVQAHHLRRGHRGRSRRVVCHRCIPLRGIMCIFIRRAVSILIRTCRRIAFFIERAASLTRVQQTL